MAVNSGIILNHLNYTVDDKPIISDLNISFLQEKYGIVGRNGIGKSTLLKLIAGELRPSSGSVQVTGDIAYFSQDTLHSTVVNVAAALGVAEKLQALQRVAEGSVNEHDFSLIGDDWLLAERVEQQLSAFMLGHISLERSLSSLSGGEQARLLLAKSFLARANYLIFDEPTNHLDSAARQALYQAIKDWGRGLIVVSHDRELLNLMNNIVEISQLGVHSYGGAYDDYVTQKNIEQASAQQTLQAATQARRQAERLTQERRERHERGQAKGRQMRKSQINAVGRIKNRIELNSAKGRSERTQRKIILQAERKLTQVNVDIEAARRNIEQTQEISIDLPHTKIPNGKMILQINNIGFRYPQQQRFIVKDFSLEIQGPERLAILGDNGSGKTTLVKLILGELLPNSGEILLGADRINYLDQRLKIINPQLSVLENFLNLNPDINELDARYHLADFLFRNETALKLAGNLSGGERLRAALACILLSAHPPQLLILDEPTNHLDLAAMAAVESALQKYQGALIVISHDMTFLKKINIEKTIHI